MKVRTLVSIPVETGGTQEMKYAVIFEKADHNWAAYVPDLPGCVTTGTTLDDTRRLIAEAIALKAPRIFCSRT
jgi:hypothetical protein